MRNMRLFIGLLCCLPLFATVAFAQFPVINADDVKVWMRGKEKVMLIDSRLTEEYRQAHLPGAISIPAERMKQDAAKLPGTRPPRSFFIAVARDVPSAGQRQVRQWKWDTPIS